ncbi:MAG: hypothetical protein ACJAZ3_000744 [Sphingobacteriales bacterium]|jgi:hypothetical protein
MLLSRKTHLIRFTILVAFLIVCNLTNVRSQNNCYDGSASSSADTICLGDSVVLRITEVNKSANIQWQNLKNNTWQNIEVQGSTDSIFTYYADSSSEVRSRIICASDTFFSDTFSIIVCYKPVAWYYYESDDKFVELFGIDSNKVVVWDWDFSRSDLSSEQNTSFTADFYGTSYNISLRVANQCGEDQLVWPITVDSNKRKGGPGIETRVELNQPKAVKVYPNPVIDFLTIEGVGTNYPIQYFIENLVGQLVQHGVLYSTSTINLASRMDGIYFISLIDPLGNSSFSKVLKTNR